MKKMRTTLVLFAIGMMGMVLTSSGRAADVAADATAVAVDPLAGAVDPLALAAGCPKCTCACSPFLGAWVGCFAEEGKDKCDKKMIETFKFSMMNLTCDQFVLNLQASFCEEKVRRAFPEAEKVTEFVGVACKSESNKLVFTAVGYGVKKKDICDEVVFIAIKSGTISLPCSCGDPNGADVTQTVQIFAAEQDTDCDGLPDECDSVICLSRTGMIKRIVNRPQCEPAKSFVARLEPCKDVQTEATGKAFFKRVDYEDKLSFVVTVKDIKDVTKVVIHVSDKPKTRVDEHEDKDEAFVLCPIDGATECKSGEFSGLLCCGTIMEKDGLGPMKGKKMDDVIKAIVEGRAVVIIKTRQNPKGEICGRVEDP